MAGGRAMISCMGLGLVTRLVMFDVHHWLREIEEAAHQVGGKGGMSDHLSSQAKETYCSHSETDHWR